LTKKEMTKEKNIGPLNNFTTKIICTNRDL